MKKQVKIVLLVLVAAILGGRQLVPFMEAPVAPPPAVGTPAAVDSRQVERAFEARLSDVQVSGTGVVARLLPDDNKGRRHQKFILRLAGGQTLLIAHNIDLAPRIADLAVGDRVEFNGEYEWNRQGGVVHWTHHDPAGRHEGGWLKHDGKLYQ